MSLIIDYGIKAWKKADEITEPQQLETPILTGSDGWGTFDWNAVPNAVSYDVYCEGNYKDNTTTTSYYYNSYPYSTYLNGGFYAYVVAKGDSINYLDSEPSAKMWMTLPCLIKNTSITLADRTYKLIQDITYDDNLLVWNFDNATFMSAKPIWIMKQKRALKYNHLVFSDGSALNTVNQHRIFNVEKGMFTYPMTDDTPIGTTTFNDRGEYITLVSKEIINKEVEYYNIITDYHMNLFTGTILTSCRLSNIYPIVNMQYVKDNRELHSPEIFNELDDKWVSGLRLLEQPLEINRDNAVVFDNSLLDYVKRLERDKV